MISSPDSTVAPPRRDLMAPNAEPTDEELHAVMVAARDTAVRREAISNAWTAARLAEAAAVAAAVNRRRGVTAGCGDE